jgi:hypothetical protein
MKDNLKIIKNKDLAFHIGITGLINIQVNGKMD